MAYERQLPTDEVTGLPFPIYPTDLSYADLQYPQVNYHHHFYNRRDPDLEGENPLPDRYFDHPEDIPFPRIAGIAVRMSRGQRLPVELHNRVHETFQKGPVLPQTIEDKFMTAVKACTGVVSRWGIDVTADDPRFVYMDDSVYSQVASQKLLCTERAYLDKAADRRRRVLGNFFLRYAIKQDFSHVADKFDEFLSTPDEARRLVVGHQILKAAMEVSIEPVMPVFKELKSQGMVHPRRHDPLMTVWKSVHPQYEKAVFRVLKKKLLLAA